MTVSSNPWETHRALRRVFPRKDADLLICSDLQGPQSVPQEAYFFLAIKSVQHVRSDDEGQTAEPSHFSVGSVTGNKTHVIGNCHFLIRRGFSIDLDSRSRNILNSSGEVEVFRALVGRARALISDESPLSHLSAARVAAAVGFASDSCARTAASWCWHLIEKTERSLASCVRTLFNTYLVPIMC